MLVLSNEEVERLLPMSECLDALECAFRDLAEERAVNANRVDVVAEVDSAPYPGARPPVIYSLKTMPAVLPRVGMGSVRIDSDLLHWPVEESIQRRVQIPAAGGGQYVGLVLLFSSRTGELLSMFPDGVCQRLRVAATSALGAKYFARQDARVMGLLGSGWQAGAQVLAHCAVRSLELIKVYSPNKEHRERFAEELSEQVGVPIQAVDHPRKVFEGTDIVQAATNSREPVMEPDWIQPGQHLGFIVLSEVTPEILARADLVGTNLPNRHSTRVTSHAPKGLETLEHSFQPGWWQNVDVFEGMVKLGDLLTGQATGRTQPEQITIFNSHGMSVQFTAVGARLYERARAEHVGRDMPDEWFRQPVPG